MDSLPNNNTPSLSPEPTTKKHPQKPPTMTSQSGERRLSKLGQRAAEQEHLPCPRCNSTNTKFCYYNNYNLSQPRHFCKSCRRYWTRGGTLRDVPVGGGTRTSTKPAKRPRFDNDDVIISSQTQTRIVDPDLGPLVDLNEAVPTISENDLSYWWTGQMGTGSGLGCGLFPFNGYGSGLGEAFSCGYNGVNGVLDWSMEQVGGRNGVVSDTWQMMSSSTGGGVVEGGEGGDYFSWPELAISTPPKALK